MVHGVPCGNAGSSNLLGRPSTTEIPENSGNCEEWEKHSHCYRPARKAPPSPNRPATLVVRPRVPWDKNVSRATENMTLAYESLKITMTLFEVNWKEAPWNYLPFLQ